MKLCQVTELIEVGEGRVRGYDVHDVCGKKILLTFSRDVQFYFKSTDTNN